jgi:hypothetical protein
MPLSLEEGKESSKAPYSSVTLPLWEHFDEQLIG